MRVTPILYQPGMIRALWAGHKTQTRRTRGLEDVNDDPDNWTLSSVGTLACPGHRYHGPFGATFRGPRDGADMGFFFACPYGGPGDLLWCKETFRVGEDLGADWEPGMEGDRFVIYSATGHEEYIDVPPEYQPPRNAREVHHSQGTDEHWRSFGPISSLLMPRWASRLTLLLTDVRVQRLQEISEEDAMAEGLGHPDYQPTPRARFANLWHSINAKRGYGWWQNPWLWALTFRAISANVDEVLRDPHAHGIKEAA